MTRSIALLAILFVGLIAGTCMWRVTAGVPATSLASELARRGDIIAALATANRHDHRQRVARDGVWRREVAQRGKMPLVQSVMQTALSRRLTLDVAQSQGQIEQIMLVDAGGCLIAADHPTHDYDQSDEPKWLNTVGAKSSAALFEGRNQSPRGAVDQVSQAVSGPDGSIIGLVTVRYCNTPGGCT